MNEIPKNKFNNKNYYLILFTIGVCITLVALCIKLLLL